ncbi:helix-turn-helix domain-containing protein [Streptomyces sp. NPDC048172]|uniref:helix-turn-helix domain-containing protein n=1 Tax=Streptomyces sp. NPDC048172 TaxID=3365505 RepID=UPI00371C798B
MKSVQDFDPAALIEVRERAGLSQADLAHAAGAGANSIGRWERGKGAPSPRLFASLAEALNVPPSRLLRPLREDADLASLRTRVGLRQEDVAERLGVQASDVSELELGTGKMRAQWAGVLQELFDVSLEDLTRALRNTEAQWRERFEAKRGSV